MIILTNIGKFSSFTELFNSSNIVLITELDCSHNQLTTLPDLSTLVNLRTLWCSYNQLTTLPSLSTLVNLRIFDCSSNQLTTLPDLSALVNLRGLYCTANRLVTLPVSLVHLRQLEWLNYSGNEIEYIPPNVQRFIDRLNNRGNAQGQQIYENMQNVHTSSVQSSVKKSLEYLLTIRPTTNKEELFRQINNEGRLTPLTKRLLQEYSNNNEIHSVLQVTFLDILLPVWTLINTTYLPYKEDLLTRMNEEIADCEGMCYTGRLSRLVSILVGFDPNVQINISDSEQIAGIIVNVKNRLESSPNGYSVERHRELVRKELEEREYFEETIATWINGIEEDHLDENDYPL